MVYIVHYFNNTSKRTSKLAQEFLSTLTNTIEECLQVKDTYLKQVNYLWFKTYLLYSNVWFVKQDTKSKQEQQSQKKKKTIGWNSNSGENKENKDDYDGGIGYCK